MSKKSIYYLVSILLLFSIFLAQKYYNKKSYSQKETFYFSLDSLDNLVFTISSEKESITLERLSKIWSVKKPLAYKIDPSRFNELNDIFSVKYSTDPVSENSKNFHYFSVSDTNYEKMVKLTVNEQETNSYYFGFSNNYSTCFSRTNGIVFELSSNIIPRLREDLKYWIDKYIIKTNKENIYKIDLAFGKKSYQLIKGDSTWNFIQKKKNKRIKNDNNILQQILETFTNLTFDDILFEDVNQYEKKFLDPYFSVSISGIENLKIYTIQENDNNYVIKKDNYYYRVSKSKLENIFKTAKDFNSS